MDHDLDAEYLIMLTGDEGPYEIRVDVEAYLRLNNEIDWALEALEARWSDMNRPNARTHSLRLGR